MEEDWDTLIILDACRYDLFKESSTLPGNLQRLTSRGPHTSQFLYGNFNGKMLLDTVYTTSTPQLHSWEDEIEVDFFEVNNVWNTDRWDEDIGTVPPEEMTQAAKDALGEYPKKRHIVHYLQPHYPFIQSEIGTSTRSVKEDSDEGFDLWEGRFRGQLDLTQDEVWSAYRENLLLVLNSVESLLEENVGKTVVTSDHGNMIGERARPVPIREWGHPRRLYTEELVTVPWLEVPYEERRSIEAGTISEDDEVEDEVVQERLESLGYV